jgi:protein arginine kinase
VAFGDSETLSVMVNEEDHLRLQAMSSGFDLRGALDRAVAFDRALERRVAFAHNEEFGYFTCCPTNVGTGLRASVMMHLPALAMVRKELEKVFAAAQRTSLAVRGLYGEGSRAVGDFYQISNQVTLGRTETQLVEELEQLIPVIVRFERSVRNQLLAEQRRTLEDRVVRSYGLVRAARSMDTDKALEHLSNLRLGHYLNLLSELKPQELNRLRVQIQKGHVAALSARSGEPELLEPTERDKLRAGLLRKTFVK